MTPFFTTNASSTESAAHSLELRLAACHINAQRSVFIPVLRLREHKRSRAIENLIANFVRVPRQAMHELYNALSEDLPSALNLIIPSSLALHHLFEPVDL